MFPSNGFNSLTEPEKSVWSWFRVFQHGCNLIIKVEKTFWFLTQLWMIVQFHIWQHHSEDFKPFNLILKVLRRSVWSQTLKRLPHGAALTCWTVSWPSPRLRGPAGRQLRAPRFHWQRAVSSPGRPPAQNRYEAPQRVSYSAFASLQTVKERIRGNASGEQDEWWKVRGAQGSAASPQCLHCTQLRAPRRAANPPQPITAEKHHHVLRYAASTAAEERRNIDIQNKSSPWCLQGKVVNATAVIFVNTKEKEQTALKKKDTEVIRQKYDRLFSQNVF